MFLLGVWDDTYGNDSKISRLFGIPLKILRKKYSTLSDAQNQAKEPRMTISQQTNGLRM